MNKKNDYFNSRILTIIEIMNNDFDRLISQSVDILIYDYKNKYEFLRNQNFDKERINNIMNDYQKIRIIEFIDTYKTIKNLYK